MIPRSGTALGRGWTIDTRHVDFARLALSGASQRFSKRESEDLCPGKQ